MKLKKLDVCLEVGKFEIEAFEMDEEDLFAIEVVDGKDVIIESHAFTDAWEGLEKVKELIKKYEGGE